QLVFAGVEECRIELLEKGAVGILVLVHADAEDDHSLGGVGGGELAERGGFLHARGAPGGPEVEHQEFAPEVGQGYGTAVIGADGEFRRRIAGNDHAFVDAGVNEKDEDGGKQHNAASQQTVGVRARHDGL